MRAPLNFRRHFLWLGGALALIALVELADLVREPLLPSFALYGALHAITLVLALPAGSRNTLNKLLFIGGAAALNVAVLYAGILSLQGLREVLAELRLYLVLSVCALFGAIAYGFWVRLFWWPALRPRAIAQTALGCLAAVALSLALERLTRPFGNWWLVAVWWLAFSAGLWRAVRRAHALGPQAHAE